MTQPRFAVAHCAGGHGPQPQGLFEAVVDWVEQGKAPNGSCVEGDRRRNADAPALPYPADARWSGQGSSNDAANFVCVDAQRN
jgi:feruloyl esterase